MSSPRLPTLVHRNTARAGPQEVRKSRAAVALIGPLTRNGTRLFRNGTVDRSGPCFRRSADRRDGAGEKVRRARGNENGTADAVVARAAVSLRTAALASSGRQGGTPCICPGST